MKIETPQSIGFMLLLRSFGCFKYEQNPYCGLQSGNKGGTDRRMDGQTAQGTTIPSGPNGLRVQIIQDDSNSFVSVEPYTHLEISPNFLEDPVTYNYMWDPP